MFRVWHVKIHGHVVDLRTIFFDFFSTTESYRTFEISNFGYNDQFWPKLDVQDIIFILARMSWSSGVAKSAK